MNERDPGERLMTGRENAAEMSGRARFHGRLVVWALPFAATALAVVTRYAAAVAVGDRMPFLPFVLGVLASGWLGGLKSGLLAMALSTLALLWFSAPPTGLVTGGAAEWIAAGAFLLVGLSLSLICARTQRNKRRLEQERLAMAASDERLRALLASTAAIVWTTDAYGAFLAPQPSWETYTGQSWAEHGNWGWIGALHPDDRQRIAQLWQQGTTGLATFETEGRVWHRPSGTYRYFVARAVPLKNAAGAVMEWSGALSDIHDRVVATEALRTSQDRLRRLSEANIVGVIQWNLDDTLITDCNDEFLRMTGYERADLAAGRMNFEAMTPPEWQARNRAGVAEIRSSGAASAYEKEYFRKDGSRVPVIIAGARFDNSPREGMSFVLDLTERKRAEDELRNSEKRFRSLADSIPQLAWMVRPDGHIFWYNRRWYEYTGTTFEEVEGWGWARVHDPAELPRVLRRIKYSFATGEPWEDTFPLRRHDGAMRWHLSRMLPVRDGVGNIVMWFGTNTDITDEKAHALRQGQLADIALKVSSTLSRSNSLDGTLQMLIDAARQIVGAQQARIAVSSGRTIEQPVTLASLSNEYTAWGGYTDETGAADANASGYTDNKPLRLSRSDRARSGTASAEHGAGRHSALRGSLAVPLVGSDGHKFGLLRFWDKTDKTDFDEEDESIAVQLAATASALIENWHLLQ
ncbi:MAG: PAS domain S-box protein, partial [Casimicrobiaceae bacterium]